MLDLLPVVLDQLWDQTRISFAQPWELPFSCPQGNATITRSI